jgi:hypothetical protein
LPTVPRVNYRFPVNNTALVSGGNEPVGTSAAAM